MPRISETRNTAQPQAGNQAGPRQVRSQVFQGPADNLPSYIPPMRDPDADALLQGLSQFQPKLAEWAKQKEGEAEDRGSVDRMAGREQQESGAAYARAYFATDGLVKGQEDGANLMTRYNTEFDKDKGDLEGWLQENYQTRLQGVQDEHYLDGYQKGVVPAFQAIRKAHIDYQREAVETRVKSNAKQLLLNGVRAYVTQNQPVPEGYIASIQDYMGKNLGVSSQQFGELLFDSVRQVGDEGHFEAYDLLKKDRPDGSPGIYYDPAFTKQIDQAQAHSYNVSEQRAHAERDKRQNVALYDVFAEEDPIKAQVKYDQIKKAGLFTRADDLIKWDKLMLEKSDGKPDVRQLEREGTLLASVYQGKLSYRDILKENSAGDITSGQRKYLLGEIRRVQNENQQAAAAAGKAEEAIYKTMEFRAADEFLQTTLAKRPRDLLDLPGQRSMEFDQQQLAQARLELVRAAKGKNSTEVQPLVEEITSRYMKRREGYDREQQKEVAAGRTPFKSLQEVMEAGRKGTLSPDEYRAYSNYFKSKTQNAR